MTIVSGFAHAPYQTIIRRAGRIIALSAGFHGRETLLKNAAAMASNTTAPALVNPLISSGFFATQLGAMDLCFVNCMALQLFQTAFECQTFCKGTVLLIRLAYSWLRPKKPKHLQVCSTSPFYSEYVTESKLSLIICYNNYNIFRLICFTEFLVFSRTKNNYFLKNF